MKVEESAVDSISWNNVNLYLFLHFPFIYYCFIQCVPPNCSVKVAEAASDDISWINRTIGWSDDPNDDGL